MAGIGDQIKVAIQPDLLARIDADAERQGITRSAWLRNAARAALGG